MNSSALLGTSGIVFMCVYLASLILVGLIGRLARKEDSMADFYLAGRGMGLFVLFLTLYATQYSGNTLIGFAGKAYREGYLALVSVTFMMAVIGGYFIFASRLYKLSKINRFITVGDYIQFRFGSTALTILVVIIGIVALGNYILTNLKAVGHIVEASTGGNITFLQGVIGLSLIMVIYETLGGLRSVAWTDAIQGVLLLAGCVFIFGAIEYQYGGLSATANYLMTNRPELWQPPTAEEKRLWFSTLLIVFFAISIYPHAIQRIYAAKDETTLRHSFQIMVFMPIVTTLFIILVGVVGSTQFPGLGRESSEEITLLLLGDLAKHIPTISVVMIIFITAAVAAIMSTIDSALLAISSLFTQDLYRLARPNATQSHLTNMGKISSWIIMAFMAYLAISLPQTIWRLMEIKLEILCQVAPAIFLGVHIKNLGAKAVLYGLVFGTIVTLILMFGNVIGLHVSDKPWGIHAGIWGLGVNFIVIGIISFFDRK